VLNKFKVRKENAFCDDYGYGNTIIETQMQIVQKISIDKNVSILCQTPRVRYPFSEMGVGDSFIIFDYKKAESARVAALLFTKRRMPSWRFSMRKTTEGWRLFRLI
jgi:hypothetical protein